MSKMKRIVPLKEEFVHIRMTRDEKKRLYEKCKEAGKSFSDYVRGKVFEGSVK